MSNIYDLTSKNIDKSKLTPMLKQYLDVKEQHQDVILFYRMGDFYETFLEDALITAKALEITLTSREAGGNGRIAMAGIPAKAMDNYMQKMLAKGLKVAICDQMEDPSEAKGLVKREVTRTISAGTVIESTLLDANQNNYLAALTINQQENSFALAYCDITTGEFRITQSGIENLNAQLERINPAEILAVAKKLDLRDFQIVSDLIADVPKDVRENYNCTLLDKQCFSFENAQKLIKEIFNTENLNAYGYPEFEQALCAAGAILSYLRYSQRDNMSKFDVISPYSVEAYMNIDANAQKGLELTDTIRDKSYKGSLLWAINQTSTNMGSRLLRNWLKQPLLDVREINLRQDGVEELLADSKKRMDLKLLLDRVYDVERLAIRITNNSANARDYLSLKQSLANIPQINELLADSRSSYLKAFEDERAALNDLASIIERTIFENPPVSIKEGNLIKEGVNEELDYQRNLLTNGKAWLEKFEEQEKEKTGVKSLRVGYSKSFGYFIEVTHANTSQVPENYIRKQTLTNAERYITPELKKHEDEVLNAQSRSIDIEYQIFSDFREYTKDFVDELKRFANDIAALDVLLSFASCAYENNYVRPVVDNSDDLIVQQGRHAVLEKILPLGAYVDNDLELCASQQNTDIAQFIILTGPNMAGKSTYMRQNALIVILAQIGSFIPAKFAKIGVVDKIFTRIGAVDDLTLGQSTFMVEMLETANILNCATSKSLILLDEIGRGTSTYDGVAIAWSVSEFIANKLQARCIFATHYHELNIMADSYSQIKNYKVTVNEENDEIEFLRKVVPGSTSRSYGIQVAKMAGLPNSVVSKAMTLMNRIQKDNTAKINVKKSNSDLVVCTPQLSLFED